MKKPIAIALLVLLVIFLVFKGRQTKNQPENSSAPGSQPKRSAISSRDPVLKSVTDNVAQARKDQDQSNQFKSLALAKQAGFKDLPIEKIQGIWQLKIRFVSTLKHCELGDLDLIRIDQKRRKITSLLLSLDDLNSRKNLFRKNLNVDALADTEVTVSWPSPGKPRSLGLYLCSDVEARNSCFSAKVDEVNQSLNPDRPAGKTDRIYYFQFLQEGAKISLLDSSRAQAKNPETLRQALAHVGLPQEVVGSLSQQVAHNHLMIGSMAPRFEQQRLLIDLPQNEASCPMPHLKF